MKYRKTKIGFFTIPQYKKEQEWLRKQHRLGWKLISTTFPLFYHFEKCEPEDVIYQLDYNPNGIANEKEYVQMFQDCGWEHIIDFVGYSYFRKSAAKAKQDEEIFCDDDSRLDMIRRVFKGRVKPMIIIFCGCIIPQLFVQCNIGRKPHQILFVLIFILFILYTSIFIQFGLQYWKLIQKQR